MTRLSLLALLLVGVGCNGASLPLPPVELDAVGCLAVVSGSSTAQLGGVAGDVQAQIPSSTRASLTGEMFGVACQAARNPNGAAASFDVWPRLALGPFSATGSYLPDVGGDSYRGRCTGIIDLLPAAVGDPVRGTFACAALVGQEDASSTVTVADGAFFAPLGRQPPE